MARAFRFRLSLTYQECLQYYEGTYTAIQVMAHTGQRVQFPAEHIRPYVTSQGVNGTFEMEVDSTNKFKSLKKLS